MRYSHLLLLSVLGLSGCVRLGPDFETPEESWVKNWSSPAIEQATINDLHSNFEHWWLIFDDPVLNKLISHADAYNTEIKLAGIRVLQARAQLGVAQSGRYPQLQQVSAESLYLDHSQRGGVNPRNSHSWQYGAGFDIGWEPDFWGSFNRAIESADASYFSTQANYENVSVLLRAQVADTYFALRTTEARLHTARQNAAQQKRSYEITEKVFKSGQSAELDLQQARTQYLGTLSSLPELEDQLARIRNALALLLGEPPGDLPELSVSEALIPLIDQAVLRDVPAKLLLRRPDIRAAELDVAAQSALIGVAKAELYPSLSLLGSIAWSSNTLNGASNTLDLIGGPSLRWNLNHSQIKNNVRIQDARLQQLIEIYRDRVRQAAREADDAANGFSKALEREIILRETVAAAKRSVVLASAQYQEGFSDFQRVLDAQQALFIHQESYLLSRSSALSNLIALYKALGGGWSSNLPLIDQDSRKRMELRTDWGDLINDPDTSVTQGLQR